VKHAAKLQRADFFLDFFNIGKNRIQRRRIVLRAGELEQPGRVRQPAADALERADDAFELLLFLAEGLRALLVFPQLRVFQLAVQRVEATLLGVEVKDTSAAPATVFPGR